MPTGGEPFATMRSRERNPSGRSRVRTSIPHVSELLRREFGYGAASLLEGLSEAVAGFVPDRALSRLVELGACLVQPHQQKNRASAQAAERRFRYRRSGRQ